MYYTWVDKALITGCSLAEVIQQSSSIPKINSQYLKRYLVHGFTFLHPNDDTTLFQNIFRVPDGHELYIEQGRVKYKHLYSLSDLYNGSDNTYSTFESLLVSSVQACLPATSNELGFELSGGIDSSMIAALVRECIPHEDLTAFTNTLPQNKAYLFENPSDMDLFDEYYYSKQVATHLNLNQILIHDEFHFHDVLERYTECLGSFNEVLFPLLNHRTFDLARAFGIKVLLSGFGGDEMVTHHAQNRLFELKTQKHYLTYLYEILRKKDTNSWLQTLGLVKKKNARIIDTTSHLAFIKVPVVQNAFQSMQLKTIQELTYDLVEGALSTHFSRRIETTK